MANDYDGTQIGSIGVVGGGDAGLMTALALEKGLDGVDIFVVDDFDETVPEVGKSTLQFLQTFLHDRLEITPTRLVEEVKLGFKTTVYLKDWCGQEFHSPLGKPLPTVRQEEAGNWVDPTVQDEGLSAENEPVFDEFYYRYQEDEYTTVYNELAETVGKSPMVIDQQDVFNIQKGLPDASYHFNSNSFNRFLRTICGERGVELINDRIDEVTATDGWIERVAGSDGSYDADLYIDASGFRRMLMDELEVPMREFDLPVDSAVVATTDLPLSDIESATIVTSGEAGWFWQIDTVDVRDLGYVYSSDHVSDDDAVAEFLETRPEEIDPDEIRRYRFESGVLESPWKGNCLAVGNAVGFVEPLQSTALTTSARLADRLATFLGMHGRVNHQGLRELFNETTLATWEEIYDFVSLYYKYNSGMTAFWEDAREVNPGPIQQVDTYRASGFCAPQTRATLTRTGTDLNNYYLYYLVLKGLGVESVFYENLEYDPDPAVVEQVEEYTDSVHDRVDEFLSYEEFYQAFHPGFDD
ncbi:tryptophan 7-halogenase [Natrialba swarupiae]|uniref:Tryptophan 7-halogenase n=1 Tax=Natrialba swarupiae TaxID=2448032 RepID=A0A5D5AW63_9EURY|nr:tryptophan 7-halogenase [Natrialba swarupiae]TYT63850.1 tryptophan 7-halogenase [Natrialba swarupiae]